MSSRSQRDDRDARNYRDQKKKRTSKDGSSRTGSPDAKRRHDREQERADRLERQKQAARAMFNREEKQSLNRSPDEDMALHEKACDSFKAIIEKINSLKSRKQSESTVELIRDLRAEGSLHFLAFKKLNRLGQHRNKQIREKTSEYKAKIDNRHLSLQNLQYEAAHLQKEIQKCLDFKSQDEEIDLVDLDQFFNEAPDSITNIEVTSSDEHQLKLARLDWELHERKRLAGELKTIESAKEEYEKNTDKKRQSLNSLAPELSKVMTGTRVVQDMLNLPFERENEQMMTASLLPRPLYILYQQGHSYSAARDENLIFSVEGDSEEAENLNENDVKIDEAEASDSDAENEDEKKSKKKRRRKSMAKAEKQSRITKIHPLFVRLKVNNGDSLQVTIKFSYFMVLGIVTVKVEDIKINSSISSPNTELLTEATLLTCLFEGDSGKNSPNPSTQYLLENFDDDVITNSGFGRPYRWAQVLAGLNFLPEIETEITAKTKFSQMHMENCMEKIKARLAARIELFGQVASLEKGVVNGTVEFPVGKTLSGLSSFKSSTFEDYKMAGYTQPILDNAIVENDDFFYTAVLSRASASITCQIAIIADYPKLPPIWSLKLNKNGDDVTGANNNQLRDLEAEINVHVAESTSGGHVLSAQVAHLLTCMDIYLETYVDDVTGSGERIQRDKMFSRISRGPHRSKPYQLFRSPNFFSHR